jgi:hypothetical protein
MDSNPRFACLSRFLKYSGGHLESLKLLRLKHNVVPEKAGVGGSTPSLARMFFQSFGLRRRSPQSFRPYLQSLCNHLRRRTTYFHVL